MYTPHPYTLLLFFFELMNVYNDYYNVQCLVLCPTVRLSAMQFNLHSSVSNVLCVPYSILVCTLLVTTFKILQVTEILKKDSAMLLQRDLTVFLQIELICTSFKHTSYVNVPAMQVTTVHTVHVCELVTNFFTIGIILQSSWNQSSYFGR